MEGTSKHLLALQARELELGIFSLLSFIGNLSETKLLCASERLPGMYTGVTFGKLSKTEKHKLMLS